ncbi:aspartate-semialdehyde dehydrogenase [Aedoeadaptatus nemausensis]|uniref:Aspartate-semialdehyde dehydrogenase n=1 Tax=Aedoeadaptatus nemausensis TaxID=2582829 RepID=A0A6V6Y232_9FIRM|nr:aspartate-semialdehyde dehydrogenase [Peptoniphilus nemausensis]CAC9929039.1 aspartate-semialdehyde dehydrogenase [Peptoniphilus nemausensis]
MVYRLAILGATGLVGQTMRGILEEKDLPLELTMFASANSAGKTFTFKGEEHTVQKLTEEALREGKFDYVLSALDGGLAGKFCPVAAEAGSVVIDNSSHFRMEEGIPLVVPEINAKDGIEAKGIIANPNCSTIQSVVALKPVEDLFKMKRVVFTTFQAVSGSGVNGIADLERGIEGGEPEFYPHPIAYNCLPHIDDFLEDGYTKEEMKMVNESRKIFHRPDLAVTATAVRVPVKGAHAISVNVTCENPVDLDELRKAYEKMDGVVLQDDVKNLVYPLQIEAEGKDEVFVGRIRKDDSCENSLNLWVVADNIRKGAALNAIQILEKLLADR